MEISRLEDILSNFKNHKIAVVGDFFLDKYLYFDTKKEEMSIETGKIANQVVKIVHSPGAAGNIVKNIVALGASEVVPVGFTGVDGEGFELRSDLEELGCNTKYLVASKSSYTPTYMKPQNIDIVGLSGENDRYDIKNHKTLAADIEEAIIENIRRVIPQMDAVIIADQVELKKPDCGAITKRVREELVSIAKENPQIHFWVDSRVRMIFFENMLLKPNKEEAIKAVFGDNKEITLENAIEAGRELYKSSKRGIFLTCGEDGMLVFGEDGYVKVPTIKLDCEIDCTGAGDSATSGSVLSLCSGATLDEAAFIGNLTASVTVQKLGTTGTASQTEIKELFNKYCKI